MSSYGTDLTPKTLYSVTIVGLNSATPPTSPEQLCSIDQHIYFVPLIVFLIPRLILLTMFHNGDLQSGIALALSHTKLLACFVAGLRASTCLLWRGWLIRALKSDDTQESSLWEQDYLQDITVHTVYVLAMRRC